MLSAVLVSTTAVAGPPQLTFPVECEPGQNCHIQQTPDRDPGLGATDHACGTLSYDGHTGTDIRLPDLAAMARGTDVVAAAPGRVRAVRDGMADRVASSDDPRIAGRGCGNGVLIDHEGGWQTQYCHLAQGSVSVAEGARVSRGARLGRIGLSGATEFPHVEFILRDADGAVFDPADGRRITAPCGAGGRQLWSAPVAYAPGGALAAGILDRVPDYDEVKAGRAHLVSVGPDAGALVVWGHFFGVRKGDIIALALRGPDGREIAADRHEMDRDRAVQYRAAGRRARGPWPAGRYVGEVRLLRGGSVVDRMETGLRVSR